MKNWQSVANNSIKRRNKKISHLLNLSFSCKITSGEYCKIVFSHFLADNWIFFLFPILVCACLSVFDVRIIIVALMLLFIVVPFVMILLYSYYILTDSMIWSISDKKVTLTGDETMILEFENSKLHTVKLSKSRVKRVLYHKGYVLFQVENVKYRFFVIPEDVFDDDLQRDGFMALFT